MGNFERPKPLMSMYFGGQSRDATAFQARGFVSNRRLNVQRHPNESTAALERRARTALLEWYCRAQRAVNGLRRAEAAAEKLIARRQRDGDAIFRELVPQPLELLVLRDLDGAAV